MFCGACGTENPEKNRYCVICRADLADQRQSMRVLPEWQSTEWQGMLRECVFGHPRNWPTTREDELEAYASGRRDIQDRRAPPYMSKIERGNRGMAQNKQGSIGAGIVWMFVISLLLFWLPVIGPFIAGLVGGKRSGGIGNAIAAVFLAGIVFGVLLFALATSLTGIPLLGAIAGVGGVWLALVHVGPLLIGAVIGGLIG